MAERETLSLSFVSLLATDKIKLPGLLYQPDSKTRKAAVWLHGMGDNGAFYNPERINTLGEALAKNDVALLAFNNRGAHNRKGLHIADETLPEEDQHFLGGTHYELIADCVKDIDGAAEFLKDQGFSELYLMGHSTGANKICAYHVRAKKNPFKKYVLAGPGDDVGLFFTDLGEKRYWQALKYAAAKTDQGDPLHTMPKYTGMYPFSAQSAHDILDPDGAYNTCPYYEASRERLGKKPLFDEYRKIDKPTLVIFGQDDEFMGELGAEGALKLLMKHTSNAQLKQADFMTVAGADHGFHDHEQEFAEKVRDWLAYE
ncbi:MAG TPA: alpha/beta hydrolase [Candidatus Saccharimonadales bacterium]|nr:alpha/beta hydrolase [Candidatus Saccharimonadales bacterium]